MEKGVSPPHPPFAEALGLPSPGASANGGLGGLNLQFDCTARKRFPAIAGGANRRVDGPWPQSPPSDLATVERCIAEFCQFDPDSMSFRYPVTKWTRRPPSLFHQHCSRSIHNPSTISLKVSKRSCCMSAYAPFAPVFDWRIQFGCERRCSVSG